MKYGNKWTATGSNASGVMSGKALLANTDETEWPTIGFFSRAKSYADLGLFDAKLTLSTWQIPATCSEHHRKSSPLVYTPLWTEESAASGLSSASRSWICFAHLSVLFDLLRPTMVDMIPPLKKFQIWRTPNESWFQSARCHLPQLFFLASSASLQNGDLPRSPLQPHIHIFHTLVRLHQNLHMFQQLM